jgi:predicted aldo/keto reductase-like oxidoreductase
VGWVGFSGHADVEIIREAVNHEGNGGFDYLNLHWYTIFQRNSPALQAAAERNMGVFIISPTDKGGMLQKPPQILTNACAPLTAMQFNDLYCLQRPEIHTISVGASSPAEFTDHLAILPLLEDHEQVASIYRKWQQLMESSCGSRRPDALWEKLPLWYKIPGYMNIGYILWLYNIARGWDLLEYARNRYQLLGIQLVWVPGTDAAGASRYRLDEIARSVDMSGNELITMLQAAHQLLAEKTVADSPDTSE